MKAQLISVMIAAAGLLATGSSFAVDAKAGLDLATKQGCTACHSVDKKLVGPSFKEIAKKNKGAADAEARLIKSVKEGVTKPTWGPIPMPANSPKVNDADIKTLVQWVMAS